jgi:uncharacterized protein
MLMTREPDALGALVWDSMIRRAVQARAALLKGSSHAAATGLAPDRLLHTRLWPDMLPLGLQARVLADGIVGTVAQVQGRVGEPLAHRVFNRGEADLQDAEAGSLEALCQALQEAAQQVGALQINLSEWQAQPGVVEVVRGQDVRCFSRTAFIQRCVLPNVHFHAVMVHALLRHGSVPLGKDDFIGLE